MARKPKKKKSAKIVQRRKRKTSPMDPNIEEIYEEEVTFHCPTRGLIKQKVKVKRYKSMIISTPHIIGPDEDKIEDLGE
jgi:hypothetical protein